MSFQTKLSECLVTVELTPDTYIPLKETLFFQSCLLSTVTATPSDSNYVSRSASLERVRSKSQKLTSTTFSIRSACAPGSRRTKSLQTVATRVVPATASFYSARGISSQASAGAAVNEESHRAGKTSLPAQSERFPSVKICRL